MCVASLIFTFKQWIMTENIGSGLGQFYNNKKSISPWSGNYRITCILQEKIQLLSVVRLFSYAFNTHNTEQNAAVMYSLFIHERRTDLDSVRGRGKCCISRAWSRRSLPATDSLLVLARGLNKGPLSSCRAPARMVSRGGAHCQSTDERLKKTGNVLVRADLFRSVVLQPFQLCCMVTFIRNKVMSLCVYR